MEKYVVKQEDLIGQLDGFPIEVVQFMVDEQVRQGNKADVKVFQKKKVADKDEGGFKWGDLNLNCARIIIYKNFDLFFKRFPKQELPIPRKVLVWGESEELAVERELLHIFPEELGLNYNIAVRCAYNESTISLFKYFKELPPSKKMTKEEIEKELGYKIEMID